MLLKEIQQFGDFRCITLDIEANSSDDPNTKKLKLRDSLTFALILYAIYYYTYTIFFTAGEFY